MNRRTLLAGSAAAAAWPARAAEVPAVDLLLVLAIDVSRSIVESDAMLQRQGYRAAMRDPEVLAAIRGGPVGAIAVAYVEWAAFDRQQLLLPWTRIASPADAAAWADALEAKPWTSVSWTSLSGALRFSGEVLAQAPFEGTRRVIDVSGDGVNNNGPPAEAYRDGLVAGGVVINGLPIINERPRFGGYGTGREVVPYYRESVAGGPGSFVIVAETFDTFGQAVKRKLIQEIA
jgi:hypothetical protein